MAAGSDLTNEFHAERYEFSAVDPPEPAEFVFVELLDASTNVMLSAPTMREHRSGPR
jgi:hypothetical protein